MMKVVVRLNAFGHAWMRQTFKIPQVFNGLMVNTDPARPYDDVTNVRLEAFKWIAPDFDKRNEGWYECSGFPFGAPSGGTVETILKALEGQGWVREADKVSDTA